MPSIFELVNEAAKPGLLGRAGIALETRFAREVSTYFKALAASINLSHLQDTDVALIGPHLDSVITRGSPKLEAIISQHAKVGYLFAAKQTAFYEADGLQPGGTVLAAQQMIYAKDQVGATGRQAAAYARIRAAESVTGIDDTTRDEVRRIIEKGIADQEPVFKIVQDLKAVFGEMSTVRAKSIANTEMNMAMSTASFAKIKSVGLNYKRAIPSPGACPICIMNQRAGAIPVDEPFPSGHMYSPFHPGKCRCSTTGVRDERVKDYGKDSSEE